jgi:hypothetical protein
MWWDFCEHGPRTKRVRKTHPAVYLKICAMRVPRELHVQNDPIAKLTGEQIGEYLEILKQCVEDRRATEAKVRKLSTGSRADRGEVADGHPSQADRGAFDAQLRLGRYKSQD